MQQEGMLDRNSNNCLRFSNPAEAAGGLVPGWFPEAFSDHL